MPTIQLKAFVPTKEWPGALRGRLGLVPGATTLEKRGSRRRLLVLVHGWYVRTPITTLLGPLLDEIPDTDILAPRWYSAVISNASPERIARDIRLAIRDAWEEKEGGYEEIILAGYSCGAVLLKKAFLLALGINPQDPLHLATPPDKWTKVVKRVVLIAGMDRGWHIAADVKDRAPHSSVPNYWITRAFEVLMRPVPVGRFIRALKRGSPFVADLRIAWLRHFPHKEIDVVQVLGDTDEIVARNDMIDVFTDSRFVILEVGGSGHYDLIDLRDPTHGNRRKRHLREALIAPWNDLERDYGVASPSHGYFKGSYARTAALQKPDEVENFVFLLHGIRANADWCDRLKDEIVKRDPTTVCQANSYGFVSLLRFLLAPARRYNVDWFADQYTEAMARFPRARFHFIGHSNGTFVLAKALELYPSIVMDRVAFAGSVVTTRYDWSRLADRVGAVRNYRGSKDIIVGIFPYLYELLGSVLPLRFFSDLGGAGFIGFRQQHRNHREVFYVDGGHGAVIATNVFADMTSFVLGKNAGNQGPAQDYSGNLTVVDQPPGWAVWAHRLNWLIVLGLIGVAVLGGWWLWGFTIGYGFWYAIGATAGYALLLYLLLNTV